MGVRRNEHKEIQWEVVEREELRLLLHAGVDSYKTL